jgi:hypothetical protein
MNFMSNYGSPVIHTIESVNDNEFISDRVDNDHFQVEKYIVFFLFTFNQAWAIIVRPTTIRQTIS